LLCLSLLREIRAADFNRRTVSVEQ